MTVWIINGKTLSIQDAVDYVSDSKKTAKSFDELRSEYEISPDLQEEMTLEEYYLACEDNINRALNYVSNEDKIDGYISGYLCDPELAEQQFRRTKEINLSRVGKELKDDNGNYFYHIIQSFPEELDISDSEVHQCGIELVERLGLYQAVVTSHIHPEIDEDGKIHGKCKHNHILINSHIYHEFVDPANPYKMKYHDCKESYAQLQLINDQIAIEHGLPIIASPEKGHGYSWFESAAINKGKSWKQQVRTDIANAMKTSNNIESFEKKMNKAGYKLRFGNSKDHGEVITYTTPDEKHRVRDYKLGRGYTKSDLEIYWGIKKDIKNSLEDNKKLGLAELKKLLSNTEQPLYIQFEKKLSKRRIEKLQSENKNIKSTYTNYYPLLPQPQIRDAEKTYFEDNKKYKIVNEQHQPIAEVTGSVILEYLNRLQELQKEREIEEERRLKEEQQKEYYYNITFIRTATKTPYKIRLWDEHGRKRSLIELIVLLAIVTIHNEYGKWEPAKGSKLNAPEIKNHPIYAKRDWKVQNMIDTVRIAREENINTLGELDERLNNTGKELRTTQSQIRRVTTSINKMDVLFNAIEGYKEVKNLCEKIRMLPDGTEKELLENEHEEEIQEYKKNKNIMYRFKVNTEQEIQDFYDRYTEFKKKIPVLEKQEQELKEEYRRLSKLNYNLQLAQNKQYCYGPEYKEQELSPTPQQETQRAEERTEERTEGRAE